MNPLQQLLRFVSSLQEAKVQFRLDCVRDAIMVIVPSPSSYYEIEFFADGHIESQVFGHSTPVQRESLDAITQKVIRAVNGDENSN